MATVAPLSTPLAPPAALEVAGPSAPAHRLQELMLRYSEGSIPYSLWLPAEEEWEAPPPSGLWGRLRHWFNRLASAELGNDDD